MRPLVSILTPSKHRPESLELCKKWVAHQTYPKIEHVVVTGGKFAPNMVTAIKKAKGDLLVVFEDDDYYSPGWVMECVRLSKEALVFGCRVSRVYHVPSRQWKIWLKPSGRMGRGILGCSLGFEKSMSRLAIKHIKQGSIKKLSREVPSAVSHHHDWIVALKGLYPNGISKDHDPEWEYENKDPDMTKLKEWIGDGPAEAYARISS